MSLTKQQIETMQNTGTFGYWDSLTGFISRFIERNYPLSKADMQSIVDEKPTENAVNRQIAHSTMFDKLKEIINREIKINREWLSKLQSQTSTQDVLKHPKLKDKTFFKLVL